MASSAQAAQNATPPKVRNPLAVIGLTLITIGIYGIYWYYTINREMADIGRARGSEASGTDPMKSLLAVTLGALVIVPAFMSLYGTWQRLNATERLLGLEPNVGAVPGFLLSLFLGPVGTYMLQSGMNKAIARAA